MYTDAERAHVNLMWNSCFASDFFLKADGTIIALASKRYALFMFLGEKKKISPTRETTMIIKWRMNYEQICRKNTKKMIKEWKITLEKIN